MNTHEIGYGGSPDFMTKRINFPREKGKGALDQGSALGCAYGFDIPVSYKQMVPIRDETLPKLSRFNRE